MMTRKQLSKNYSAYQRISMVRINWKFIYCIKERIPEELWELFYEEIRKKVIKELNEDQLLKYNPRLHYEIAHRDSKDNFDEDEIVDRSIYSIKRDISYIPSRKRLPSRKIREVKIGDNIIYDGMTFLVTGWRGTYLIVKDKFGNIGEIPNNTMKYTIL